MEHIVFRLFELDKITRGKIPLPGDLVIAVHILRKLWRLEDNAPQHQQQGQVQLHHKLRFLSLQQNNQQIQEWHQLLLQYEKKRQEQRELERSQKVQEVSEEVEEEEQEKNQLEIKQLIQKLQQNLATEKQTLPEPRSTQRAQRTTGLLAKEKPQPVSIIQRMFNRHKCSLAPENISEEQKPEKARRYRSII